jgi:hypothetical protein
MERLTPILHRGDIEACEHEVANEMRALALTPFHLVLDLSISNDPAKAAAHFDRFFQRESKRLELRAAYTEMNGFDINPDRWYCYQFAYSSNGGHNDDDWLSDWQSEPFEELEINGLEQLQDVYASDAFEDKANCDASYMCSLMVVVKFQRFMQRAASLMNDLRFPLYVTAHDFDFIAAMPPNTTAAQQRL